MSQSSKEVFHRRRCRRLSTTFRSLKIQRTSTPPSKSLRFPSSTLLPSSSSTVTIFLFFVYTLVDIEDYAFHLHLATHALRIQRIWQRKSYAFGDGYDCSTYHQRLRQHNGELNRGAKASRAGRPWVFACIIQGFNDQSEACEFESRWKIFLRKTPSRRSHDDIQEQAEDGPLPLLRHRNAALDKVKGVFDCGHLVIEWKRSFS